MRAWSLLLVVACTSADVEDDVETDTESDTVDTESDTVDTDTLDTDVDTTPDPRVDTDFVPVDDVLATGPIDDPEIASPSGRMVWIDRVTGSLWTASLNAQTGAIEPATGRGAQVDAEVAPFDRGENGAEWFKSDRGDELLYFAVRDEAYALVRAWWDGEAWTPEALPGPVPGYAAYGTTVDDDPNPLAVTWTGAPPSVTVTAGAMDGSSAAVLPGGAYFASWFPGEHTAVVLTGLGTRGALVVADADAESAEVVQADALWGPRAWGAVAPETGGRIVAAEVRAGVELARSLEVFRETEAGWVHWSTVTPPADRPFLANSTVFVHGGRTWAAFLAMREGGRALAPPSELWLASLDPEDPVLRKLSAMPAAHRRGVEVWAEGVRPWVYLIEGTGASTQLRRCETGLGTAP